MTIREIAKLAQVSPATVSLVLNNKNGVGTETRKRILEIVNSFGYIPKAKSAVVPPKGNIRFIKYKEAGLLVERNGDFISRVIDGIEDGARTSGLNLKITNVTSNNFEQMVDLINNEQDDGIIFLGTEFQSENAELLKKLNAPVVVVDNEMRYQNIDSIVMNNEAAVFSALKYLKDLGHTRIGHIRSNCVTDNFYSREMGFLRAVKELGLSYRTEDVYSITPDLDDSYNMLLKSTISKKDFPTAYFADNDVLAVSALRVFKQIGKSVPGEISVIGMDDLILGAISDPKLTTVKIYKKKMGQLAVSRLMEKIQSDSPEVLKILVDTELITRESTAAPCIL